MIKAIFAYSGCPVSLSLRVRLLNCFIVKSPEGIILKTGHEGHNIG